MKKTIIIVMVLNLLSKILAFGRDITQSYYFGVSYITDAYIVALTIPNLIFGGIGEGIISGYIPIYSHIKHEKGINRANNFTNNFIIFILLLSVVVIVIGVTFSSSIVQIFSSGFDKRTLETATLFTRVIMISVIFYACSSVISGFLQLNNKFYIVGCQGIVLNVFYILGNYFGYKYGNIFLAIFVDVALISQLLILLPSVKKMGFKFKLTLNIKDEYLKEIILISIPVILGTGIEQINLLVDKIIASRLGEGAISILNYGGRLNTAIFSLSISVVLRIMFPKITTLVSEKRFDELKKKIITIISLIIIFITPTIIFILILAKYLITIIFGHGNFNIQNIIQTSKILSFYSFSLIGLAFRSLFINIFYSYKDTKTPVINSSIGIVINIILSIFLSRFLGVCGIALGTSISIILVSILLGIQLIKKHLNFWDKRLIYIFLKSIVASFFMVLTIILLNDIIKQNIYLKVMLLGLFSFTIYLLLLIFLNVRLFGSIFINKEK